MSILAKVITVECEQKKHAVFCFQVFMLVISSSLLAYAMLTKLVHECPG